MLPAYKLPCTATLIGKDDQGCCNMLVLMLLHNKLITTNCQVFSSTLPNWSTRDSYTRRSRHVEITRLQRATQCANVVWSDLKAEGAMRKLFLRGVTLLSLCYTLILQDRYNLFYCRHSRICRTWRISFLQRKVENLCQEIGDIGGMILITLLQIVAVTTHTLLRRI